MSAAVAALALPSKVLANPDAAQSVSSVAQAAATEPESVVPPVLLTPIAATYPVELTAAYGLAATVTVGIVINELGAVESAHPVTATHPGFVTVAVDSVRQARFKPATYRDEPVRVELEIDIEFVPPVIKTIVAATATVEGVALERGTLNAVAFVAVIDRRSGREASGDGEGRFSIAVTAPAVLDFRITAPGYQPLDVTESVAPGDVLQVEYLIERQYYGQLSLLIEAERKRKEVSRRTLQQQEIVSVPGTNNDALRVVQTLPGVNIPNEFSGQLLVRGSEGNDNQFFVDGMPLRQLYHFGGLSSVINSYMIEKIDFYPSNFSARYGDATGGVIDVTTRPGRTDRHAGSVSIGTLQAEAYVEGPIKGDKFSYVVAGRRSYFDAILIAATPARSIANFVTAPRYYDYQMKVAWLASDDLSLEIFSFGGEDAIELILKKEQLIDPDRFNAFKTVIGFHNGGARLRWRPNPKLNLTWTSGLTAGNFELVLSERDYLRQSLLDFRNLGRLQFEVADGQTIELGGETDILPIELIFRFPRPPRPREYDYDIFTAERQEKSMEFTPVVFGLYADYSYEYRPIRLTGGVRVDGGIWEYSDNTLVDPRVLTEFGPIGDVTLRAAWGGYSAFPEPNQVIPEAGGQKGLGPEHSWHYLVGGHAELPWQIQADVDFYYKDFDHLVRNSDDPLGKERYNNNGTGRAYGAEVSLRKPLTERLFGWFSFAYGRVFRDDIFGQEQIGQYDQPMTINLVASYQPFQTWRFGGRWRFTSGNPQLSVQDTVFYADRMTYLPLYTRNYTDRLPDYQRLDLRVDKLFIFDRWILSLFAEVLNVYMHTNIAGQFYNYDYSKVEYVETFPILPNLGVKADF